MNLSTAKSYRDQLVRLGLGTIKVCGRPGVASGWNIVHYLPEDVLDTMTDAQLAGYLFGYYTVDPNIDVNDAAGVAKILDTLNLGTWGSLCVNFGVANFMTRLLLVDGMADLINGQLTKVKNG